MESGLSARFISRRGAWALGALALILLITAGWWAFALWPLPTEAPAWLARARATCFGVQSSGLPHMGGWLLLIGEPLGMVGILLAVWGDAVLEGFRGLAHSQRGRGTLALTVALLAGGAYLAGVRISELTGEPFPTDGARLADASVARVDRTPPPLRLVDQAGDTVTLERFKGRPLLLAFAFGHCQTACPVLVRHMLAAQRRAADSRPALLFVTLDPWRDTPERLPHIAEGWGLSEDARFLGGSVEAVEAVLEAWQVARGRDPHTGEIAHSTTVYAIGRDGRIAYQAAGLGGEGLAELVGRL
jgi:cytochrome oxidase Cu insertion factor (SCO1/SenC/PrrC family)